MQKRPKTRKNTPETPKTMQKRPSNALKCLRNVQKRPKTPLNSQKRPRNACKCAKVLKTSAKKTKNIPKTDLKPTRKRPENSPNSPKP
ncbi:hypothetical protein Anapl_18301 [Anas platyrhynchos]|uniref:Uncharacterized protein n=1 Tax=Anas platyrhynchos TaxID=8839 RepID=R0KX02_ANAPL|nr:hypothetical protein Anapl_18301 [Anas platyrhynchos]